MVENRVCLIICFYNGSRSGNQQNFYQEYVKAHMECLRRYKNNLSRIVFAIADDKCTKTTIHEDGEITYVHRSNRGLSFGAWVEISQMYMNQYDYYIYCEDDYVFVQDNFDDILVRQYQQKNVDYLVTWKQYEKQHTLSPNELVSTIGIVSHDTLNRLKYLTDLPITNDKCGMMCLFLNSFRTIACLDQQYNLFPYYAWESVNDRIYYHGYDNSLTKKDNLMRILLASYQYYKEFLHTP